MSSTPSAPPSAESDWPGRRLGLPASGPRSIARIGRRLLAILIDWGCATLLSFAFFRTSSGTDGFVTLGLFAAIQVLFLETVGGSPGYLTTRMRLVPLNGGRLQWWQPLWRTALLCVVIPAVIWDRDQRGVHDRWSGTVIVRI